MTNKREGKVIWKVVYWRKGKAIQFRVGKLFIRNDPA